MHNESQQQFNVFVAKIACLQSQWKQQNFCCVCGERRISVGVDLSRPWDEPNFFSAWSNSDRRMRREILDSTGWETGIRHNWNDVVSPSWSRNGAHSSTLQSVGLTFARESRGLYATEGCSSSHEMVVTALVTSTKLGLCWARLILDLVTRPLRPTQPGHPFVGQVRRISATVSPRKKWRVQRNNWHCYQDCWHTGLLYASLIASNLRRLKGIEDELTDHVVYA